MLGDIDKTVRRKAVKIILKLRENGGQVSGEAIEKKVVEHAGTSDEMAETSFDINQYPPIDKLARLFKKPLINFKAPSYYQMTPLSQWKTSLPVLKHFNIDFIKFLEKIPLKLEFECHSQNIESHVKIITKAAGAVCGHN